MVNCKYITQTKYFVLEPHISLQWGSKKIGMIFLAIFKFLIVNF